MSDNKVPGGPQLAGWIQPVVLTANGIRLEPLEQHHAAGLLDATRDGELWRLRVASAPEPEQVASYIATALAARQAGQRIAFAVLDAADGRALGSTSFCQLMPEIRRVEIGYTWYRQSVQRSHVNTTAKYLLMRHAFEALDCAVVGWRTDILNQRSQRAIERLGARRDGVIRHHQLRRDGTVRDTVMYSMLASEWPEARERLAARLQAAGTPIGAD